MKVSFNFGTQKNIDPVLISSIINYLIKEYTTDEFSNLHAGTGTMYINFYDTDGISKEIVAEDGSYTEYVVRGEPYQRKPKNVVSAITFGHNDEESGERVIDAYVYERYVWMK